MSQRAHASGGADARTHGLAREPPSRPGRGAEGGSETFRDAAAKRSSLARKSKTWPQKVETTQKDETNLQTLHLQTLRATSPNTAALPSRSERSQHAPHSAERDRAESGLAVVDAIRKHEVVAAHEQT